MATAWTEERKIKLARAIKTPIIASGGLHSVKEVQTICAKLVPEGVIGAIAGRALYEGAIEFRKAQAAADKPAGKTAAKPPGGE